MTSYVLPAAMNTSFCTRPLFAPSAPEITFPSSAISWNPPDPFGAVDPTIAGTCIREPAFTNRTRMLPLTGELEDPGGFTATRDAEGLVLLNGTPLMR